MFFIGIFGIEEKEKIVKVLNNFTCNNCNGVSAKVVKRFTCFHIFFIPIFKWNEEYFVVCSGCNTIYTISKEKGKAIESGEKSDITYWDLRQISKEINRCPNCGSKLDDGFTYCPYCGQKLK